MDRHHQKSRTLSVHRRTPKSISTTKSPELYLSIDGLLNP
jgi:hypothetical protein